MLEVPSTMASLNPLLLFAVCFGITQVGSAFIVLLPGVGQGLAGLWLTVFGERVAKGQESGTHMPE